MMHLLKKCFLMVAVAVITFGIFASYLNAMEHQPPRAIEQFRERIGRLSVAARADSRNGEKQLRNVILHFNEIASQAGQEQFARDFPAVQRQLSTLHMSLGDFYSELMNDVAESLDGTLQFKLAHAAGGNLKDHVFYETLTSVMGRMHNPTFYWCECTNATVEARLHFVCAVLNHILTRCPDMSLPVSYTDDGEEGCLQTYLVAHGLAMLGCRQLSINVINVLQVITEKDIPAKLGVIQAKLNPRYPMRVDVRVFDHEHILQAAETIRAQPGMHIFVAVDPSQDIDGWFIEEYKRRRAAGEQVLPINAVSFSLARDRRLRKYEVTVNFRRHGNPRVCFEPIYPELMVAAPQVMRDDYQNITATIMRQLASTTSAEVIARLCDGLQPVLVFESDFGLQLVKHMPDVPGLFYIVKHNSAAWVLDDLIDLAIQGDPDGHAAVFLLGDCVVTQGHVEDGLLRRDSDGSII